MKARLSTFRIVGSIGNFERDTCSLEDAWAQYMGDNGTWIGHYGIEPHVDRYKYSAMQRARNESQA